ncbi:hypothetical protein JYT79_03050 [Cardiobacterium sp. AH-315-I02]|nr:hypothetical protein [Cardiobacterium sp. AH-315-I02]
MTVLEYKINDHPGGFVGFRVARTIGEEKNYKQKYFSAKKHGYANAKILANDQDSQWLMQAEKVRFQSKRNTSRKNRNINIIVDGLRAYISTENRIRDGKKKTYFTPCFLVKKIGAGQPSIMFRTNKHGYKKAYILAVKKLAEIQDLPATKALSIMAAMPDKKIFTGYLLDNIRKRDHTLSKKELLSKLQ